jgi:hypothetical protein
MMPSSDPALEQAFEYLFPLYEMARTRYNLIESPRNPGRLPPVASSTAACWPITAPAR